MKLSLRPQFTMRQMLAGVVVSACIFAYLAVAQIGVRRISDRTKCMADLKGLGAKLALYLDRYGSSRDYPGTIVVGGSGYPVPPGPNGAFWSWLYRVPTQATAISQRPGDDALYLCAACRHYIPTGIDFTCPAFGATWPVGVGTGAMFPGGRLSAMVRGDAPVGGDVIGPPDKPNHGGLPGAPNQPWVCLYVDGRVEQVEPGSSKHTIYAVGTTGGRTS